MDNDPTLPIDDPEDESYVECDDDWEWEDDMPSWGGF
jgi:hypothetical protein